MLCTFFIKKQYGLCVCGFYQLSVDCNGVTGMPGDKFSEQETCVWNISYFLLMYEMCAYCVIQMSFV